MRKSFVGVAALMLLLLTACDLNRPRVEQLYSLVDIVTQPVGDELRLVPTAVFFRTGRSTPPDSREMGEGCLSQPHDPAADDAEFPLSHIDGGDSVVVATGLSQVGLYPFQTGLRIQYEVFTGELFTSPNSPISVNTVGADGGFPAMQHNSVALGPPNMLPLNLPVGVEEDMPVSWQAAPGEYNRIELGIVYREELRLQRLVCVFNDDGSASVPAVFVDALRRSTDAPLATATRFRSSFNMVGTSALVVVVRAQQQVPFTAD